MDVLKDIYVRKIAKYFSKIITIVHYVYHFEKEIISLK